MESFLLARDLFLKPGGSLYPSQGGIWFALFSDEGLFAETEGKVRTQVDCGAREGVLTLHRFVRPHSSTRRCLGPILARSGRRRPRKCLVSPGCDAGADRRHSRTARSPTRRRPDPTCDAHGRGCLRPRVRLLRNDD